MGAAEEQKRRSWHKIAQVRLTETRWHEDSDCLQYCTSGMSRSSDSDRLAHSTSRVIGPPNANMLGKQENTHTPRMQSA